ncbi:hypothetical protein [Streptomyces sp. NBC_01262]|uniref:hypothetical protein n=1 Tax=Streptomyces sp. NBC_01262 TaxID=2903803 RepID=UPI002E32B024|nr:hypothetical protein [Streptomyces sp. NBC_01262]
MMQIGPEVDVFTDDNTSFHVAVDAIVAESTIDDHGRWIVSVDVADAFRQVYAGAYAEISSWVLCYEPPTLTGDPPAHAISPPEKQTVDKQVAFAEARHNLIARLLDGHQLDQAVGLVPETIAGYRQYARLAGADVMRAGRDLGALANQMAGAGRIAEAVGGQQAAVDVYRAFTPGEVDRLVYEVAFAEARHNLIARLLDGHQLDQAVGLVPETIAGYRQYARLAGADVMRAGRDLGALANQMAGAGRIAEAVGGQQAAVDVYRAFTPGEVDRLVYEVAFAEARHNLIARLLDGHQLDQAVGLVPETIAGYRQYARLAGADVMRAGRDLGALANQMAGAGRIAEAVGGQQAAVDVYRAFTPGEVDRLVYEVAFAEARHNLIARLLDGHQLDQAVGLVPETIAGYRQYARLAGADVMRAGRDLGALANQMAGAGRTVEAEAAQQAADEVRHNHH